MGRIGFRIPRRVWVLSVGLALVMSGCANSAYLVPSADRALPRALLGYQQSVETRYQTLTVTVDQAIRAEEVVLSQDPRYAPGYIRLGGLFLRAGQPQAALRALETACHLAPNNGSDWVVLGQAEAQWGSASAAMSAYRHALAINPGNWRAWDGEGFLAVTHNEYSLAWKDGQAALLAAGEEGPTLDLMGRVLLAEGDASDALIYFSDAQAIEPSWWQSYYDAGRADAMLGNRQPALDALHRALQLNPTSGSVWALAQSLQRG